MSKAKAILVFFMVCFSFSAEAQKTKTQLQTEINNSWPDNNTNQITPRLLRGPPQDMVNSYLDLNGASSFTCPGGQVLTGFSSLSTPVCTAAGSGTVSSVGTGVGLTGGPITTTGTISLTNPTTSVIGGVKAYDPVANQWINSISTTGQPTSTRPTCANLLDASASCSVNATNASNLSSGTLPSGRFPALVGDVTTTSGNLTTTLATVNGTPGSFGSPTQSAVFVVNGKGLVTTISQSLITPALTSLTGFGTNVQNSLAVNIGAVGSVVLNGGVLGSPSSVGTMPAFTFGGTVSGNGQSIVGLGGLTFNPTTGGINGTTTNNNANGGVVGEYIPATQAVAQSLTTGTALSITSASLTAGDWDVSCTVSFQFAASTVVQNIAVSTSQTLNTNGGLGFLNSLNYGPSSTITPAGGFTQTSPTGRYSLAGTTTVYCNGLATFTTSTATATAFMRARRVR